MNKLATLTREHRFCLRCEKLCRPAKSKNPDAKPFRKAVKGFCPDCVTTHFILSVEPLKDGIKKNGTDTLLNPMFQKQFEAVLKAGNSELPIEEINWSRVVDNWAMPWPIRIRPRVG